jgi:hypothetical protein
VLDSIHQEVSNRMTSARAFTEEYKRQAVDPVTSSGSSRSVASDGT